jgi:hypothetical protein
MRFSDMLRLVCDFCGAHHTRDVVPGQLCPLCGIGRLQPLEKVRKRGKSEG